jgi:hypothetical protein
VEAGCAEAALSAKQDVEDVYCGGRGLAACMAVASAAARATTKKARGWRRRWISWRPPSTTMGTMAKSIKARTTAVIQP